MDSSYLMMIYFSNKINDKNDKIVSNERKSCLRKGNKTWFSCFKKNVKFSN